MTEKQKRKFHRISEIFFLFSVNCYFFFVKKKKERNQQKKEKHKKWMGARVTMYGQGKNPVGKNALAL